MPRTKGSTNIKAFDDRYSIPVSTTQAIQLRGTELAPLEQFKASVRHQRNYLEWLQSRHDKINKLKAELVRCRNGKPPKRTGAKDKTHRKYSWFAECMALLDVINSFEFFYKASCIGLATALTNVVPASRIKGVVEARFIWQSWDYSAQHLIFEHRLFHDLKQVNEVTEMLIGKTYYKTQANDKTYRCIHAIFQIRHTLSHNCGQMTQSDATKLQALGFEAWPDGAIDPRAGNLGKAIFRFLEDEAQKFTDWLEKETFEYIKKADLGTGGMVPVRKSELLKLFNGSKAFDTLNLIPEFANDDD